MSATHAAKSISVLTCITQLYFKVFTLPQLLIGKLHSCTGLHTGDLNLKGEFEDYLLSCYTVRLDIKWVYEIHESHASSH